MRGLLSGTPFMMFKLMLLIYWEIRNDMWVKSKSIYLNFKSTIDRMIDWAVDKSEYWVIDKYHNWSNARILIESFDWSSYIF